MKKNRSEKAHAPKRELSLRSDEVKIYPYNTTVPKNRQPALAILGPMIGKACDMRLYGLVCDLALLCHSRAFGGRGARDG